MQILRDVMTWQQLPAALCSSWLFGPLCRHHPLHSCKPEHEVMLCEAQVFPLHSPLRSGGAQNVCRTQRLPSRLLRRRRIVFQVGRVIFAHCYGRFIQQCNLVQKAQYAALKENIESTAASASPRCNRVTSASAERRGGNATFPNGTPAWIFLDARDVSRRSFRCGSRTDKTRFY